MECDVDHSLIERQKKTSGMNIAHPHDWATLIRCTNKKKPFNVILFFYFKYANGIPYQASHTWPFYDFFLVGIEIRYVLANSMLNRQLS